MIYDQEPLSRYYNNYLFTVELQKGQDLWLMFGKNATTQTTDIAQFSTNLAGSVTDGYGKVSFVKQDPISAF